MRARLALPELLLLALSVGCKQAQKTQPKPPAAASARAASELIRLAAPRGAGRFHASHKGQRQEHPRLPDTGEWRCAEQGRVVWCAGGEAAAGVVSGPPDPGYRCGPRWGSIGERVCIDEHPDYPGPSGSPRGDGTLQSCKFEQERGIARECELVGPYDGPALPAHALPACWLDRDCPSGHCERGACACSANKDCAAGSCAGGVCVEVKP